MITAGATEAAAGQKRRVSFSIAESDPPAAERTAGTAAYGRPVKQWGKSMPGMRGYQNVEPGGFESQLAGYESVVETVGRRRSGGTQGGWCCGAPAAAAAAARQEETAAAPARRLPRRLSPYPEHEPEPEPEPDDDEGEDTYLSCSDDEGDDGFVATCCPPEHLGPLSSLVQRFGADAALPASHTLWRFLQARDYDMCATLFGLILF